MSWPSDGLPRYVIAETAGDLTARSGDTRGALLLPSLTVAVLDRACCHREVALFRSEDYGKGHRSRVEMVAQARVDAAHRLRELNAEPVAA